jgi:hypothetical protein
MATHLNLEHKGKLEETDSPDLVPSYTVYFYSYYVMRLWYVSPSSAMRNVSIAFAIHFRRLLESGDQN